MEIHTNSNTVTITGNIKKVSDFKEIKDSIEPLIQHNKNLTIKILDSLSLTSTTIGYLNKLVLKDGINIQMQVGDEQLLELLDDLSLTTTFKARKI